MGQYKYEFFSKIIKFFIYLIFWAYVKTKGEFMKKIILPLLLLTVVSNANAAGIASKITGILCDYRNSEVIYNFKKNTIRHITRYAEDVKPMIAVQVDDANDTIVVTSKSFSTVSDDVFKVAGKPYQAGIGPDTIYVKVLRGTDECTGRFD